MRQKSVHYRIEKFWRKVIKVSQKKAHRRGLLTEGVASPKITQILNNIFVHFYG